MNPSTGDTLASDPHAATEYLPVRSKSLINTVNSPDVGHGFSMNPYQGCEHGCIYCYARPTHSYWGYGPGLDFERKIMVKLDAPRLLEELFRKPSWKAAPIMLSGNTDCYQPIERKYRLTRQILELCLRYRHPVSIITKNALIERDLDILQELARHGLVQVAFSLTTLSAPLQRVLEPRTSAPERKLAAIQALSRAGVPVMVMVAPVIPAINDHEIIPIARAVAAVGARQLQHMVVRLNDELPALFTDWLDTHFPERKERVLAGIRSLHGGQLGNRAFRKRMRGEGNLAAIYAQQAALARRKFGLDQPMPPLNVDMHALHKSNQLDLFAGISG
jgi:DNA repair photolyase